MALFLWFHCSSAVMEQGAKINCYYCYSRNHRWKKKINCIITGRGEGGKGDIEVFLHFRLFLSWRLSTAHSSGKGQNSKTLRKMIHIQQLLSNASTHLGEKTKHVGPIQYVTLVQWLPFNLALRAFH